MNKVDNKKEIKQTMWLIEVVEIDKDLYDRFAARAKELRVSENDLFITALDAFLNGSGESHPRYQ